MLYAIISTFGSIPLADLIDNLPVATSVMGTAFVGSSHSCVMELAVKFVPLKTTVSDVESILTGEFDDVSEDHFRFIGAAKEAKPAKVSQEKVSGQKPKEVKKEDAED